MSQATETFQFKAETNQLLQLMIHSLYTNKEIFLRELISNASDALDKLRFEALTQPDLLDDKEELAIRLEYDKDARTLTIADNGIGMSRDEVIENIGTIARSGTRELLNKLKESQQDKQALDLIGQFGVGFYSCLMVADQVQLVTRRAGETHATTWSTEGSENYSIAEGERSHPGTTITLQLKEADPDNGLEDYTNDMTLRRIVKRYSDFISYPVILKTQREEVERDEEGNPKEGGATNIIIEDQTLNSMKPIWTRSQSEVKDEEYEEFYKHISNDWEKPLRTISLRAEGRYEYQSLLFIPSRPPFDLFHQSARIGLQLYVRRVLIMDHCEELLPQYLRFVKGVVDSADLPLNVSREMLQQNRVLTQMRKWLTKQVLNHLKKLYENERETYLEFWKSFGRVLKEGLSEDFENRDRLSNLLLFESSANAEELTDLKGYVERMKEGQKEIFFLTGESRQVIENSPHLEAFKKRGIEVLYLTDPIDEMLVESLNTYEEKPLKSIGKGNVELGTDEEKEQAEKERKEKEEELSDLLKKIQGNLDEYVKEVRLSNRLTTSPVCLISSEYDYSPRLERLLRQSQSQPMPQQKRILEINPEHEMLQKMQQRFEKDNDDPMLQTCSDLLFGYALLAEGSSIPDPMKFNQAVSSVLLNAL